MVYTSYFWQNLGMIHGWVSWSWTWWTWWAWLHISGWLTGRAYEGQNEILPKGLFQHWQQSEKLQLVDVALLQVVRKRTVPGSFELRRNVLDEVRKSLGSVLLGSPAAPGVSVLFYLEVDPTQSCELWDLGFLTCKLALAWLSQVSQWLLWLLVTNHEVHRYFTTTSWLLGSARMRRHFSSPCQRDMESPGSVLMKTSQPGQLSRPIEAEKAAVSANHSRVC